MQIIACRPSRLQYKNKKENSKHGGEQQVESFTTLQLSTMGNEK
jgi:hypothetical protein